MHTVEGFRLSPQQRRLWQLRQADGDSAYRTRGAALIEGPLDKQILRAALQQVVARHEILRTTFHTLPGMSAPLQVITDSAPRFEEHDLTGLTPPEQEAKLELLFRESGGESFALESVPPVSFSLARLSPRRHLLLLTLSALCADRGTLTSGVRQLAAAYEALSRSAKLSGEPAQYADVAVYLNDLLESEETKVGRTFWQKKMAAATHDLLLPSERGRSGRRGFEAHVVVSEVEPQTAARLTALAREYETSPSIFLLTCWRILLSRLAGREEMALGVACDGRTFEGAEDVLGPLVRYVPVNSRVEDDARFGQTMKAIEEASGEASKWQEYFSWELAAAAAGVEQQGLLYPAFCFDYEAQPASYSAADLTFSLVRQEASAERCKLRLSCFETPESWRTELHYDAGLFTAADAERLAEELHTLARSAASAPDSAVGELEIVGEAERRRLLAEWNDTRADYPRQSCVHELFEAQAERTPDAPAVVDDNGQLTYRELNARANQLARHLRRLGVGPEKVVGMATERSVEMVVALLAILKAGGAYLPLDPEYPQERMAYMLADAGVEVIVTQPSAGGRLPAHAARSVCLDRDWQSVAREGAENLSGAATPDNLAYVIYTSGTTGRPKGVMIRHASVVNLLTALRRGVYADLPATLRVSVNAPLSFDASVKQLVQLLDGHTLVVIPADVRRDGAALLEHLSRRRVEVLDCTPSQLRLMLAAGLATRPPAGLRAALVGGEEIDDALWRELGAIKGMDFFNVYGPTECTVDTTVCRLGADAPRPSIGRPLANMRVYVLDRHLRPVPAGVAGELHIAGAGVARCYLNRPALTAEKFIADPFSAEPGARMYKTGDLVRYLPDGDIEFLGRVDQQVKIRGYRIELGEIEAALLAHQSVRECAVLVREGAAGEPQLAAYVVAHGGAEVTTAELRRTLKEQLPDYMLPAAFVFMEALPLTPSGKVNRLALPAPEHTQPGLTDAYVAPRTPAEQVLADIWAEVLGVERVGVHDNFFALGGDSIISIQVVARARAAGLCLTARQLFQHQTVAEFASVAAADDVAAEAEQGTVSGEVALSPIQRRFFEQELDEAHHYNQAVLLEVRAGFDPRAVEQAVRRLLEHHDALRLRFVRGDDGWRQHNAAEETGDVVWRRSVAGLSREERARVVEEEAERAQRSLRLGEGPLVRAVLFEGAEGAEGRLLVVAHHLVVDGVSWRVLVEDMGRAYEAASRGEPVELGPKTTSFREWASHLLDFARTDELERQSDYWVRQLRQPITPLKTDYRAEGSAQDDTGAGASTLNTVGTARSVEVRLSAEETRALLTQVPTVSRAQINEVLLAALARAHERWSGARRLLVDVEGHGREQEAVGAACGARLDLSRTVGWFTSIYPVVLEVGEGEDEGATLKRIKEQMRAIPQRGYGYGVLRYLGREPVRKIMKELPQAEVSFNYLGQFDQALAGTDLLKPARGSGGHARSPAQKRRYLLEIDGGVNDGQLKLELTFSEAVHRTETIERLADEFMSALRGLIAYCRGGTDSVFTPSDFPDAGLSQEELDELVAEFSGNFE